MKKLLFLLLFAAAMTVATAQNGEEPIKREHRSVWMSAYVSDWPAGKITTTNMKTMKAACQKMLDTLKVNNMNAVYYHVRAMCDAMYESAYEPWSSYVSGQRGVAPPFDPFAWLLQEAHARGIEVYAWVNPYRYARSPSMWGQSELDYVYTHPEWLMTTDYETVLNPGLPEVRQRVVDVCRDIITKYDVDGLVFDDYFYNQGGSSFDLDSALYNAYRRGGGTMSQGDWRRENVNMMVHDVNEMVKTTKPWVRFGIGPAGVACSSGAVAAQYGVDPSPGSDWQYNQIYSDPMAWISRGTIDFMSPQVYWNTSQTYTGVTNWWGMVGDKFNRHVYISALAVEGEKTGWDLDEYVNQVRIMRNAMTSGNYGMVYFKYTTWRQLSGTINGKVKQLRTYLKEKVYTTPSLSPAVGWMLPDTQHGTVTGITKTALDNGSVTYEWDSVPNVRYVVYAVPESLPMSQFRCQPQYMLGISYTPRYTFPANLSEGYYHPITILDRWENEFAPAVYGSQVAQAEKPQLVYPANDATVPELAFLEWTGEEGYNYTLQVFADEAMTQIVANYATDSTAIGIADVPGLTPGKYYWRVVARGMNRYDNTSEMRSFTYEKMRITSPDNGSANVTLTPQFTWSTAQQGTNYTLEISTFASMASPKVYTTTDGTFTVPKYHLGGGTKYYARLTATYNGAQSTSDIISFTTADKVPATPQYIFPTEDGLTLYPHSQITFEPEEGIGSLRIEISTSTSFPVRSSYRGTIDDASFASPRLGDISGTVKPTDGKTYYVRARFAYLTTATGTTVQYTDYTPVLMFVYSTGVKGDVNGDGEINVQDVTALISYILGDTPEGFVIENAYINGDTNIDVQDVTALIAIILQ